jgi:hypothetical protein
MIKEHPGTIMAIFPIEHMGSQQTYTSVIRISSLRVAKALPVIPDSRFS